MGQLDAPVELRAFRGTRRTSTYREHTLSGSAFGRILATAAARGLSQLGSLDVRGSQELDKVGAQRLAEEATEVRMSALLPDLDGDLVAIVEVARWCARASEDSWLTIRGP
jgi:hypothetical protein